jgi:tetratricopeptide (TPR) repeat protein
MHEVVRHLLDCCPQCLELALKIGQTEGLRFIEGEFQSGHLQEGADAYSEAFMEALRSPDETAMREAQERLRGIGLWASVEKRPQEVRLVLLRSDPRFQTWGFFERLLEKCRQAAFVDPVQSVDLAHLALAVIEAMETGGRSPALAEGRSRALGLLGNAKRLAADFQGSEQAFRDAQAALIEGTRDPQEEANLLCLQASLWRDLGEFEKAVAILDQAITIYRDLGEPHLEGRALLKLADSLGHIEPGRGIQVAQEALALIDPSREPRLDLCGRHALAWFLNDAGQSREALTLLEISRPLYDHSSMNRGEGRQPRRMAGASVDALPTGMGETLVENQARQRHFPVQVLQTPSPPPQADSQPNWTQAGDTIQASADLLNKAPEARRAAAAQKTSFFIFIAISF